MLTKEIFEAIMGFNVHEFEQNINTIRYYPASSPRVRSINWKPDLTSINIYEVAYLAEEFLFQAGYYLRVGRTTFGFVVAYVDENGDLIDAAMKHRYTRVPFKKVTPETCSHPQHFVTRNDAIFATVEWFMKRETNV